MNKNIFGRALEIIWLLVGLAGAYASVNSFLKTDTKNGYLMALVALIGFLMFFARRAIRLRQRD
ncbi:MAG: hypothetical protein HC905_09370 [Bacteroidales bacterium]|nr:hypothetical protein [Bacteroidales bacterium]